MKLVEIFLPTTDNSGQSFPKPHFDSVRKELAGRFGGVTTFLRAPGSGLWRDETGTVQGDDIAVFEVMCDSIDSDWWRTYKKRLEVQFAQEVVMIRVSQVETI
jgi:hypothetical protein